MARFFLCIFLALATLLSLSAVDLVLPALPILSAILGASDREIQFIIACYILGNALGLLAFGSLSALLPRRFLLPLGIGFFGVFSVLASLSKAFFGGDAGFLGGVRLGDLSETWVLMPIDGMLFFRFLQGFFGAASVVFAPAILRGLFSEMGALRALAVLGSLEALIPALAPALGLFLLQIYGWQISFWVSGGLAFILASVFMILARHVPGAPNGQKREQERFSYSRLLKDRIFLRYALSQAFVLGGLLVFVFSMPLLMVRTLDLQMSHFIAMQISGISLFIIVSNMSGFFIPRFGAEFVIFMGTLCAALGAGLLCLYGLLGGRAIAVIIPCFMLFNMGLGLRGPAGFLRAIIAGRGDDDRASSLIMLFVSLSAGLGTALAGAYLPFGFWFAAFVAFVFQCLALLLLWVWPALPARAGH